MRTFSSVLSCFVLAILLSSTQAWGQLSNYLFSASTGSPISMTGATNFLTGTAGSRSGNSNRTTGVRNIGFTFNFGGTNYTQYSFSSNGLLSLGGVNVTSSSANSLTSSTSLPKIAPFWDVLSLGGGSDGNTPGKCGQPVIRSMTTGEAPNRILVVEWKDVDIAWARPYNNYATFQVRLYETTNRIEFFYERISACDLCGNSGCRSTTATIGIARATTDYMSVTPTGGSTATVSRVSANNSFNQNTVSAITEGTLYTFTPCITIATGYPTQGGTLAATNGDTFFGSLVEQVGSQSTWRPLTLKMTDPVCTRNYTMTISGPNASDYYLGYTPGTLSMSGSLVGGNVDTAVITFKPVSTGLRSATLTITDGVGFSRSYNLAARAPLVNYTGNIPEGGTAKMRNGDTIFSGMRVDRFTTDDFVPFSLTNVSPVDQNISFTITGGNWQYSITPGGTLGPGATMTPVITFSPTGFGPQPAQLAVNAGGEVRNFTLNAISAAPGGNFVIVGTSTRLDSNVTPYVNVFGCVGEQTNTIQLSMVNIGYEDFRLEDFDVYMIDTTYRQGTPRYPFLRDEQGQLISSTDYIITEVPPVLPMSANQMNLPIVLPEGQSKTLYLTFIGSLPGKRFGRAYIRTNGQSMASNDTDGVSVEGLVTFDVFGQGVGSALSDNAKGGLPTAITFGPTRIRESAEKEFYLVNTGICTLRVGVRELSVDRGDVDEFEVVRGPNGTIDAAINDLLIPPGGKDSIRIRFRPLEQGSRRAGLRLVTNDSTILVPGITERGTYYIDIFGIGNADLYANSVDFGQALIGGGPSEQRYGKIAVKNTRTAPVEIVQVLIEGNNPSEFQQDAGGTWPTPPFMVSPGSELQFGMIFAPAAGLDPGDRSAVVKFITSSGDTVIARLAGIAGTRTAVTDPSAIDFGGLTQGKQSRRTVTITNNSTMPVTLKQPTLSPGSDFSIGMLPRLELAPGQSEYLEVTYTPSVSGPANATMVIGSNGTNGDLQVSLSGAGLKTRKIDPVDPTQTAVRGGIDDPLSNSGGGDEGSLNLSGVGREEMVNGMALYTSVPNPGREMVEIGYALAVGGDVELALYDGQGRLVKVLDRGHRGSGEQRVRVDVGDLPSGAYHYRLTSGGQTLSRVLRVVR